LGRSISGLYKLNIPSSFYLNQGNGTYSFYVIPRSFELTISDVSFLDGTNIKGLVINTSNLDSYIKNKLLNVNNVSGYLIRYINDENEEDSIVSSLERIVSYNYRVEAITASLNSNINQYGLRYRINNTSDNVLLVVNPTVSGINSFADELFIGITGQKIVLSNTYFEPQLITVDFTDVDLQTLFDGIYGNQTFNYEKGLRTFYDDNGAIIHQRIESTVKNNVGDDIRKFAKNTDAIDTSESI